MRQETMTAKERVEAAYRLEKPDRPPIVPLIIEGGAGVASLAGYSMAEVCADTAVSRKALFKIFDDFGGWDQVYFGFLDAWEDVTSFMPMEVRIPGVDLPDDSVMQTIENEDIKIEDYYKILDMGFFNYYYQDHLKRITHRTPEEIAAFPQLWKEHMSACTAECLKRGVEPHCGSGMFHPFFMLSLMRSMIRFTEDLYRRPELVERVLQKMTDELIAMHVPIIKASGYNRVFFVEERSGGFFYPPAMQERFWWPYTQQFVDAFWSQGIFTVFHLDTNWDKNVHLFREKLPKASFCLQLDSTTDIFAAKEAMRGYAAIAGDVPAALFCLGEPDDVAAYVKRLIDKVGDDGGFVLDAGCSLPPHTKPENFKAFLETCKTYGLSK